MALTLKSQRQIQTDILNAIISRIGLTDVNPGSVLDVLTQSMAQEDFNQYVQMSQIVRLVDLESTTGEDLANRAFEYGLTRNPALSATGQVNITRTGYTKIETTFVSSGVLAPSIGDGMDISKPLLINDASGFLTTTGEDPPVRGPGAQIVIGRGTEVEETRTIVIFAPDGSRGVQPNTGNTQTATFYRVYLTQPLQFNHAFTDEIVYVPPSPESGSATVTIAAGTIVAAPATGTSDAINFEVSAATDLFAGESTISNVDVRAIEIGAAGNVGVGQVSTIDLEGLSVSNPSAFTTGSDIELDDSLRDRIRSHIQSLSRGTRQAVLNAIVGVVDPESSKRVVSANVILPQRVEDAVKVYIDDGSGFEPTFLPQPFETVAQDATGTTRLQLDFAPLVKAQIESARSEPFDLSAVTTSIGGLTLDIQVGTNNSDTILFTTEDLSFPATTRAEEITRIINNKATFVEARTSDDGTKVVISAKADTNEDIFVSGGTANAAIEFTNSDQSTLYLYKNDKLLSKDGTTAFVQTFSEEGSPSTTPSSFALNGRTLNVQIDGKTTGASSTTPAIQALTFDATLTSPQVVNAINKQLSGAVAELASDNVNIRIISNTELSASSSVQIYPFSPSANDANNLLRFSEIDQSGVNSDYVLNRELGTLELGVALIDNDVITAGNDFSRGAIRTSVAVDNNTTITNGVMFTLTIDATFNNDGTINQSQTASVIFDERFTGTYLNSTEMIDGKSDILFGFDRTSTSLDIPALMADFINNSIYPYATAFVRNVANRQFIEIRTNSYSSSKVSSSEGITGRNGNIRMIINTASEKGLWEDVPTAATNDNTQFVENERPHVAFRENGNTEPLTGSIVFTGSPAADGNIVIRMTDAVDSRVQDFTIALLSSDTATSIATKVASSLKAFFNDASYNSDNTLSIIYSVGSSVFLKHGNAVTIAVTTTISPVTQVVTNIGSASTLGYLLAPTDNLIVVMDNDSTNKTFPVPMNHVARAAPEPISGLLSTTSFSGVGLQSTFQTDIIPKQVFGTLNMSGGAFTSRELHHDEDLRNFYVSFNGTNSNGSATVDLDASRNFLRIPRAGNRVIITPNDDFGVGFSSQLSTPTERSAKLGGATFTFNNFNTSFIVSNFSNIGTNAIITVGVTPFARGAGGMTQWQPGSSNVETADNIVTAINSTADSQFTAVRRGTGTTVFVTAKADSDLNNSSGTKFIGVADATGITTTNTFIALTKTESSINRVSRDVDRRRSTFFFGSAGTGLVSQ